MTSHDRMALRRGEDAWLRDALAHPELRLFVVDEDRLTRRRGLPAGVNADDVVAPILIGEGGGESEADGPVTIAVNAAANPQVAAAVDDWQNARTALLASEEPSVLLHALGMATWQRTMRFCPRCGGQLEHGHAGHLARCTACGAQHFPQLDPAVIVRVTDADDRVLLARQISWPAGRFSVLAGFVEPGETIEGTVRREVGEEVGVRVGAVDYVASQPWPFPSSLMLGFTAAAETTELDLQEDEIAAARWLSRDDLHAAMEAGEVLLPPPPSIAWRLITDWLGDRVDDDGARTWLDDS